MALKCKHPFLTISLDKQLLDGISFRMRSSVGDVAALRLNALIYWEKVASNLEQTSSDY